MEKIPDAQAHFCGKMASTGSLQTDDMFLFVYRIIKR